eukprot:273051-Chlamydomonas_euryale.AAC.1
MALVQMTKSTSHDVGSSVNVASHDPGASCVMNDTASSRLRKLTRSCSASSCVKSSETHAMPVSCTLMQLKRVSKSMPS